MYLQMIENERRGEERRRGGIYNEITNEKRNELYFRSKYNCSFAMMHIIHYRKSHEQIRVARFA